MTTARLVANLPTMNGPGERRQKVLLISANHCTTPEPVFPLGLAHLSAALRRSGFEVDWLDLLFESDQLQSKLSGFGPDAVGISVRNIDDVLIGKQEVFVDGLNELVRTIHERLGCPVVLGGSGFSIFPHDLLELSGADYGIMGEGEEGLVALLKALSGEGSLQDVPGLVHLPGDVAKGQLTVRGRSQAGLEPEDWSERIASEYVRTGGVLNVQTQRGCAHRCCYCTYPLIEGTNHRNRPSDAVISELEQIQKLGARYAFIVDSVFNSSERHVTDVCEAMLRRGIKIRWGCFLRPQGLSPSLMRLMTRAGLAHIEFGSDSFCDEVLQAYQKDFTFEDVRQSSQLARSEDVDFCHFVIAGGPGESGGTLEEGFRNSQQLGAAMIMAVPGMRIYPGTPLFQRALAEGLLGADSNLLKPQYYLAPGLTLEGIVEQLKAFAQLSPNWIVGHSNPGFDQLVARLRQRGITGPLWSYFATAQRLWPMGALPKQPL